MQKCDCSQSAIDPGEEAPADEWTGFEGALWNQKWLSNQRVRYRSSAYAKKEQTMSFTYHGHLYTAIQKEELERYERLTDVEVEQLPQEEFHDVIDTMMSDLARMEDMVKRRKDMFDRMKKIRFAKELEATQGKVVELTDILMMLTEQPGRVSWKKLMTELATMRPELKDLLEQLEQQFTGKPAPMIKKYRRTEEPKTWKSKEHVPLRGAALLNEADLQRAGQESLHQELQLFRRLDAWLDKALARLLPFMEVALPRAAAGPKPVVLDYDELVADDAAWEIVEDQTHFEPGSPSESNRDYSIPATPASINVSTLMRGTFQGVEVEIEFSGSINLVGEEIDENNPTRPSTDFDDNFYQDYVKTSSPVQFTGFNMRGKEPDLNDVWYNSAWYGIVGDKVVEEIVAEQKARRRKRHKELRRRTPKQRRRMYLTPREQEDFEAGEEDAEEARRELRRDRYRDDY